MVYVEKIKVKGKTYFKLVHAIRKGNKILHKSRYLGKQLPSKARMEQLKAEFLRNLHTRRYFSEKDVLEIEKIKSGIPNDQTNLAQTELVPKKEEDQQQPRKRWWQFWKQ